NSGRAVHSTGPSRRGLPAPARAAFGGSTTTTTSSGARSASTAPHRGGDDAECRGGDPAGPSRSRAAASRESARRRRGSPRAQAVRGRPLRGGPIPGPESRERARGGVEEAGPLSHGQGPVRPEKLRRGLPEPDPAGEAGAGLRGFGGPDAGD